MAVDLFAEQQASQGKDLSCFPFLQALAEREEANRNGKLTVFYLYYYKFQYYALDFNNLNLRSKNLKKLIKIVAYT